MKAEDKKLLFYGILILLVSAAVFALVRFYPVAPAPSSSVVPKAHAYKDQSVDISKIRLKVLYVVPQNKAQQVNVKWHDLLADTLLKNARFHRLQFRGLSELNYDIFPQPVILENPDVFYDTTSTNAGNPKALVSIGEEIDRRVFNKGGNLYDPDFVKFSPDEYPVMGLVYEGVGASGGMIYESPLKTAQEIAKDLGVPESIVYVVNIGAVRGFFLINNEFFTSDQYSTVGSSLFYHEFAHTFGLPDRFDLSDKSSSNDIMGDGRYEPIEAAYLDEDFQKDLGVLSESK